MTKMTDTLDPAAEDALAEVEAHDQFDMALEPEVLTDKDKTKTVPCRKCRRRCVVTLFATADKVECHTCRGGVKQQRKQEVQIKQAHTVDPATLENLSDALINPPLAHVPACPFDPDHDVELKCVTHSPTYGPRHLQGYNGKGQPVYDQQTGESVVYQCNTCRTVISFSTMHPLLLQAQNEARRMAPRPASESTVLTNLLGAR